MVSTGARPGRCLLVSVGIRPPASPAVPVWASPPENPLHLGASQLHHYDHHYQAQLPAWWPEAASTKSVDISAKPPDSQPKGPSPW